MMICGRCHSRPLGLGGGGTEAPLDVDGQMPRPGIRRADYLVQYTSRIDAAPSNLHASGDSRSHHQQYTDLLRSRKHRNGVLPLTCGSCHDPHGDDANPNDLHMAASDSTLCMSCHGAAGFEIRAHVETQTGFDHSGVADAELVCVRCHMVGTASSGASSPGLRDAVPSSAPIQYWIGDIASHRFAVPLRDRALEQPAAVTQSCAICHAGFLPNP